MSKPGPAPHTVPSGWRQPLIDWTRHLHAIGRPATSIRLRTSHMRQFARSARISTPASVTFDDLVGWMARQSWRLETRRSYRSTFRVFFAWCVEFGTLTSNPAARIPPIGGGPPVPRPVPEMAYRIALQAAAPRERLMLRLAAELGLRRAEVAAVHSRDLLEYDGGWSLLVHGKGSKQRLIPVPPELAATLRALPSGYAFPARNGGHLTAGFVGHAVGQLLPPGVSMHALRHRFATRAYALEHDVFAVQQLLGHTSPNTTRRYVAIADDRLRRTVTRLAELDTLSPTESGAL